MLENPLWNYIEFNSLSNLDLHESKNELLETLSNSTDLPNILIHGKDGVGKTTRARLFVKSLLKTSSNLKTVTEYKTYGEGSSAFELPVQSSPYHFEIDPSSLELKDRVAITSLVKDIASNTSANAKHPFKIIIIHNVDKLSFEAQQALRRTLEAYSSVTRMVLLATEISKIIDPIRSRCVSIRLPTPSDEEIAEICHNVLENRISDRQHLSKLNVDKYVNHAVSSCHGNIAAALLNLQVSIKDSIVTTQESLFVSENDKLLISLRDTICYGDNSNSTLVKVRDTLYLLLEHLLPSEYIFERLLELLIDNYQNNNFLCSQIAEKAIQYQLRIQRGRPQIIHLEAWIFSVMMLISKANSAKK